jgi:hypothetical protein
MYRPGRKHTDVAQRALRMRIKKILGGGCAAVVNTPDPVE